MTAVRASDALPSRRLSYEHPLQACRVLGMPHNVHRPDREVTDREGNVTIGRPRGTRQRVNLSLQGD